MLTTTDVARLLGISKRTVEQHIQLGNLAATRLGRDYLIEEAEVERFSKERRKVGRPRGAGQKKE